MLKKLNFTNRPISPHLMIYSPQISSLFSIWHRITGITLIVLLTFFVLGLKIISISSFKNSLFFFLSSWFVNFIYLFSLFIFLYHALNGFRHIIWDIGFFLNLKFIFISSLVSIILIVTILGLNIY